MLATTTSRSAARRFIKQSQPHAEHDLMADEKVAAARDEHDGSFGFITARDEKV